MPTYTTSGGVRGDSLVNLKTSFSPTIALSARKFDALDLSIRSFREPLKRSIQRVISPSIGKNFLAGGRPIVWVPLADYTLEAKGKDPKTRFPVNDPLLRSGLLMKTMQQYNIWTVTEVQAAILSLPDKIWYGNLHQAGTRSGAANIPARQFAMLQSEDMDAIQIEFEIWLNERIIATLGL